MLPVPKNELDAYRRLSRKAGKIWREHGALEYRECVGNDLNMKGTGSFPKTIKPKRGETVMLSWILYNSRAHRDRVSEKVMKDPRMAEMETESMPFDVKRMLWRGFEVVVDV